MRIDTTSGDFDFTYLSLGAGVQSSALLVLALTTDKVPTPDAVIFADTGDEPSWVYDYLKVLEEFALLHGSEVTTVQKGVLSEAAIAGRSTGRQRFIDIPAFVPDPSGRGAPLRRMCSKEFKIEPIIKSVREMLGYKPRQRVKERVRCMMGISMDEIQRMKPSPLGWQTNTFPLVDLGLRRHHCFQIIDEAGLPEPQRSACVYCPYHSDAYWHWMKTERTEAFQQAVDFDYALRNAAKLGQAAADTPLKELPYMHRSCQPLDEVDFNHQDPDQTDMWAECEGMCGV